MNNGKFFAGLALGALVGSALSCFAHSNRGRKLRRDVYDAIQDLQEDAKDLAHHAKHKAEEVSSEVAGKVGEKVEEVKGKIHEIKTDFMNRIMVNTYWWRFLQLNKS